MRAALLGLGGLVAAVGVGAGIYAATQDGGEQEELLQGSPTQSSTATATNSPTPMRSATLTAGTPTPDTSTAVLPGGYGFSYPASWNQNVVSDSDPYIAKFFLTSPSTSGEEELAELEVFVYSNPQQLSLEEFFDGQERPNLFQDAAGGYEPFSAGGATGYWFSNVLGLTNYTVVALASADFVYQFADPEKHQSDGVFSAIVNSFAPVGAETPAS